MDPGGYAGPIPPQAEAELIILGVVLLVIGAVLNISILYALGAILAIIGVILWILGATGRQVGGRRYYY